MTGTGDFSRWRAANAKARGYSAVLMQQGRLYTDSDWNEQAALQSDRAESALAAVVGASGTPKEAPGFGISASPGGFKLGAGVYWTDGLRLDNPQPSLFDGADLFAGIPEGAEILIHLVARREIASAFEDPLLSDPALAGGDAALRERAAWRIGLRQMTLTDAERAELIRRAGCGHAPDLPDWRPGTGRLCVKTAPAAELPEDADCLIPPEAGYRSQENQLYRIRILSGGTREQARFVWSRENGAVVAHLGRDDDGEFRLIGAREDGALGFVSGGWVEVFDDRDEDLGRPGLFLRLSLLDGTASFSSGIPDFEKMVNPRLRRWDHEGPASSLPLHPGPTTLERGLQVLFSEGDYVVGDHWVFEARAATGEAIWPPSPGSPEEFVPPMGWGRRVAPLALARRTADGIDEIRDLRALFPSLACLQAEDVDFDDAEAGLGAETVQEALEKLAKRGGGGVCSATARDPKELLAILDQLKPKQSLRLCLAGAAFPLSGTLVFRDLGHVVVQGAGPQTIVSTASGEAAFLFEGCDSVRATDFSVNGGPVRNGGQLRDGLRTKGRLGALTALNCGDVSFERIRARCRNGPERSAACLSVYEDRRGRRHEARIRDCALHVGQGQIGISIIGASRAIVADNLIRAIPAPAEKIQARILSDKVQIGRMQRHLLRFSLPSQAYERPLLRIFPFRIPQEIGGFREEIQKGETNEAEILLGGLEPFGRALRALDFEFWIHPSLHRNLIASEAIPALGLRRRSDLRKLVAKALQHPKGEVAVLGRRAQLISPDYHQLVSLPFMAQGVVIAGPEVEEACVSGNRIEGANEGIRIAASSRDQSRSGWRSRKPENFVESALVDANRIKVMALSSATPAFGLHLGHVARAVVSRNEVVYADGFSAAPMRSSRPRRRYGLSQYGWRGSSLIFSENSVTGAGIAYAVAPRLQRGSGLWRLRDNAAADSEWAIYAIAEDVQIL